MQSGTDRLSGWLCVSKGGRRQEGGGVRWGGGKDKKPDVGFNSLGPTSHSCRHADELYVLSMTGIQQLGD